MNDMWIDTDSGYVRFQDIRRFVSVRTPKGDWKVEMVLENGMIRPSLLHYFPSEASAKHRITHVLANHGQMVMP